MSASYKFYRMMPSGKYKYTEAFNSTLDPEYHALINHCRDNRIDWKLVSSYDGTIKYHEEYNNDDISDCSKGCRACDYKNCSNNINPQTK